MTPRRLGLAAIACGLAAAAWVQLAGPLAEPPLYDGVVVVEPYRFLAPGPGQRGDPTSASGHGAVQDGKNPLLAVATGESPPQAQIFATVGTLTLAPGTTEVRVRIAPIPPPAAPAGMHVAGNVYEIAVTDQAGAPLTAPASALVSVILRAPAGVADATMERYAGTAWQPLKTIPEVSDLFLSPVTQFGVFALIAPGSVPGSPSASPVAPLASALASALAGLGSPPPSAAPAAGRLPTGVLLAGVAIVLAAVLLGAAVLLRLSRR